MKRIFVLTAAVLLAAVSLFAQNPYLPLWEYIPDGEPYVFEDPDRPGQYRVYIYGSHDSLVDQYCGREQVVWSAPVGNLLAWRYDGVIFTSVRGADGAFLNEGGAGDVLFAPDVALKVGPDGRKTYYLYPNVQAGGRNALVAKSDRPDGPFEACNWSPGNPAAVDGVLGFDPAVFVDDDGRVYGYWGFGRSYAAELDPETMATVKEGTQVVEDMVSGHTQEGIFRFFEASSMRKIADKYVFIYSRVTADGEFGLPSVNYTLAYAYSDHPLGPFTYGGTLIDGRARETLSSGQTVVTACPYGNTHGSLQEVGGRWWVFYHRQTGTDEYSRQAMVAPVTVSVEPGAGGKVTISEGEYNSEGFRTEGLEPLAWTPAGLACYLTHPEPVVQDYPHFIFPGPYVQASRHGDSFPVVNNTDGSVVGYKYFRFSREETLLRVRLSPGGVDGVVEIRVGAPDGRRVGRLVLSKEAPEEMTEFRVPLSGMTRMAGKQPLYFRFSSPEKGKSIATLEGFRFCL